MKPVLVVLLMLVSGAASAASNLVIERPWIRAMPPGSHMNAAYLVLQNRGATEVTIVGVESPLANSVSLHRSSEHAGMSHMEKIGTLVLKAGAMQNFAPGGLHLMLNGVTKTLAVGDKVPLCLLVVWQDGVAGRICQTFPVSRGAPSKAPEIAP